MRNIVNMFVAVSVCIAMIIAGSSPAAAATTVKVAKVAGKSITLTNGYTGYACTGKTLKKGAKVQVKAASRTSAKAQTLYYGVKRGWSKAKIAKALKAPKKRGQKVPKSWSFATVKRGKATYFAYRIAKTPAKAKPKPQPAPPEALPGSVHITIPVRNAYRTPAYDLSDKQILLAGPDGRMTAPVTADGSAELTAPAGEYQIEVLQPEQDLQNPDYLFETQTVQVKEGKVVKLELQAEPVPCRLIFEGEPEALPEEVTLTELNTGVETTVVQGEGVFGYSPLEAEIPAGDYVIEAEGESFEQELVPGWQSVELPEAQIK